MERKIKKSDRRALSTIIGSASISIETQTNLALRLEDCPEAITQGELDYMMKLKARLNQDATLMLKFAHKLRKSSYDK